MKYLLLILFLLQINCFSASIKLSNCSWKKDKNEIKVCVGLPKDYLSMTNQSLNEVPDLKNKVAFYPDRRFLNAIKIVVKANYKKDETGITFTGWDYCSKQNLVESDVVIIFLDSSLVTFKGISSSTGICKAQGNEKNLSLTPDENNHKSYVLIGENSNDSDLKMHPLHSKILTLIHELGHIAGLYHEYARDEMKSDPNCIKYKISQDPLPMKEYVSLIGEYDNRSIMNTCFLFDIEYGGIDNISNFNSINFLSSFDKQLLRNLYP